MRGGVLAILTVIISIVSLAIGVICLNDVTTSISVIMLCYSLVLVKCNSGLAHRFAFVTSIIVMVSTLLMATVTSYDSLVSSGDMTLDSWAWLVSMIHAVTIVPMTILTFFTVAGICKASYGWEMVATLGVFIGLGLMFMSYLTLSVQVYLDIKSLPLENGYVVYGTQLSLIMHIVMAIVIWRIFKKNGYMITSNGIEVRQ